MPKRRATEHSDWTAWTLLACLLLVGLVALTLEPLPGTSSNPPSDSVLGPAAVWLGTNLFLCLGQAVYLLLVAWLVLVLEMLLKKPRGEMMLHLSGWLVL